jgi:hypothetical protein
MKFAFGEIRFIVNYQLAETFFVLVTSQNIKMNTKIYGKFFTDFLELESVAILTSK